MIKSLLIIVVVELALFALDIFLIEKPSTRDAYEEIATILLLFIASLAASLLPLFFGKKQTAIAFLFNAVLAPAFFHIIWQAADDYARAEDYKTVRFRAGGNRYELTIYKKTDDYDIRNNTTRNGSSFDDLNGHYTEKKEFITLKTVVEQLML